MDFVGAQVATQAADRILTDDYFASFVEASRKAVHFGQPEESLAYTLTSNVPEIAPSIVSSNRIPTDDYFASMVKASRKAVHFDGLKRLAYTHTSNIGVAMDIMGAQVAMQAADRSATEDYLVSIVEASRKAVHFRQLEESIAYTLP